MAHLFRDCHRLFGARNRFVEYSRCCQTLCEVTSATHRNDHRSAESLSLSLPDYADQTAGKNLDAFAILTIFIVSRPEVVTRSSINVWFLVCRIDFQSHRPVLNRSIGVTGNTMITAQKVIHAREPERIVKRFCASRRFAKLL